MAKKITAPAKPVRDLKTAAPRTQEYCKLLQRKAGITAHDLRDAVGAHTCHNSWSLQRLADTYGFVFEISDGKDANGYLRYFFTKPVKATKAVKAANDDAKPAKASKASKAKASKSEDATA